MTSEISDKVYEKYGKKLNVANVIRDFTPLLGGRDVDRKKLPPNKGHPKGTFIWFKPNTPSTLINEYVDRWKGAEHTEIFIKAGTPFTSKRAIENIIRNISAKDVRIWDPWIGPRILEMLFEISKQKKVLILAQKIMHPEGFKRELKDAIAEGANIEVRIDMCSDVHDRHVIGDTETWYIGPSIKDAGNKMARAARVSDVSHGLMVEGFNRRWKRASPITV